MKFKNYRNSHTNEDTIYSRKNIADMSVREAFSRKDEIMSQYNLIGIPSEGELKSSPNAVWVEAYTREDGTEVKAHYRSKPDGAGVNDAINYKEYNNITKQDKGKENQIKEETNVTPETNYNLKLENITKEDLCLKNP